MKTNHSNPVSTHRVLVSLLTLAFALGLLVAVDPGARSLTVIGAGVLGNLTTYSTFALEATDGAGRQQVVVISTTFVLGFAAAALGYTIA